MSPSASRPCPVCGETDSEPQLQKGQLKLVRCRRCTMVYACPVPSEFASGSYYESTGAGYYLSSAKLESDYAPVRFGRELRLFRKHLLRGGVLDVGCSSGAFLFRLNHRFPGCYEVLGTDISGPPLDYAESRGVPVLRGDFLSYDFGGKRFDAVTFWAVLEHLLEPGRFLDKAASLLKPRGLCFVLVPNLRSLAARLLGSRYRYIYPQHLNYFSTETLEKLVADGFLVRELRSTHFNPLVLWQDWRSQGAEVSNEQRAQLLKRTTDYKQIPLLEPIRLAYTLLERTLGSLTLADNLAIVLQKKD
jgi:2-polyprenyl-3-methyl-5-hydroxy-6-metoxy-1,4-benzoquinol methylase